MPSLRTEERKEPTKASSGFLAVISNWRIGALVLIKLSAALKSFNWAAAFQALPGIEANMPTRPAVPGIRKPSTAILEAIPAARLIGSSS